MNRRETLVNFQNFIVATRDSGYKSTASALAELVDNAIEAGAQTITIQIEKDSDDQFHVVILDDGKGMTIQELSLALQFGGSSRFNSRSQLGRYGMGLPNSSLSQCRRVEVTTWKQPGSYFFNYLDVDEVIDNKLSKLPTTKAFSSSPLPVKSKSGTIIQWKKCDRLSLKYQKSLVKHLMFEIGRIFRFAIWRGIEINVCGQKVEPFDPLFTGEGIGMQGAVPYGKELTYKVKLPDNEKKTSTVKVRFVELPVEEWSKLPNDEKRRNQITKCAGVTILRADREIDYGWFFMGDKRKENYDDWWRCEISFSPDLDEAFGVTHTKQEIKETEFMANILVPDLEQIARALNNRVRLKFISLKVAQPIVHSKYQLEKTDLYLPSLKKRNKSFRVTNNETTPWGLQYKILIKELTNDIFFDVAESKDCVVLTINKAHMFYDKIFRQLHEHRIKSTASFLGILEVIIFAAARSEFAFVGKKEREAIANFKREWSSQLKTFIS
jgi:hypothetical protein